MTVAVVAAELPGVVAEAAITIADVETEDVVIAEPEVGISLDVTV